MTTNKKNDHKPYGGRRRNNNRNRNRNRRHSSTPSGQAAG